MKTVKFFLNSFTVSTISMASSAGFDIVGWFTCVKSRGYAISSAGVATKRPWCSGSKGSIRVAAAAASLPGDLAARALEARNHK